MKVIVDADPDFEGFYSIYTDEPNAINAELAGKIGEKSVADYLAKCLEGFELENAMHLNPIHPNILHDMQAAANGRDLRNRGRFGELTAKRHMAKGLEDMFGPRCYPYASERQMKRQQGRISNDQAS